MGLVPQKYLEGHPCDTGHSPKQSIDGLARKNTTGTCLRNARCKLRNGNFISLEILLENLRSLRFPVIWNLQEWEDDGILMGMMRSQWEKVLSKKADGTETGEINDGSRAPPIFEKQ